MEFIKCWFSFICFMFWQCFYHNKQTDSTPVIRITESVSTKIFSRSFSFGWIQVCVFCIYFFAHKLLVAFFYWSSSEQLLLSGNQLEKSAWFKFRQPLRSISSFFSKNEEYSNYSYLNKTFKNSTRETMNVSTIAVIHYFSSWTSFWSICDWFQIY